MGGELISFSCAGLDLMVFKQPFDALHVAGRENWILCQCPSHE